MQPYRGPYKKGTCILLSLHVYRADVYIDSPAPIAIACVLSNRPKYSPKTAFGAHLACVLGAVRQINTVTVTPSSVPAAFAGHLFWVSKAPSSSSSRNHCTISKPKPKSMKRRHTRCICLEKKGSNPSAEITTDRLSVSRILLIGGLNIYTRNPKQSWMRQDRTRVCARARPYAHMSFHLLRAVECAVNDDFLMSSSLHIAHIMLDVHFSTLWMR